MSMKPRHAAALALIGWYLMAPPMDQQTHKVKLDAPLSEFMVWKSFDTARECEADKNKDSDSNLAKLKADDAKVLTLMKEENALPAVPVTSERRELWHEEEALRNESDMLLMTGLGLTCVEADDPRLKAK